jgi:hypothetical protein
MSAELTVQKDCKQTDTNGRRMKCQHGGQSHQLVEHVGPFSCPHQEILYLINMYNYYVSVFKNGILELENIEISFFKLV